jgi:hypothetical protein
MFSKPNKQLFNDNWKFMAKELNSLFPEIEDTASESGWAEVELPHDWLVWNKRDSYKSQEGWYKKSFELTADEAKESVELTFDGVHAECSVYVNNKLVLDEHEEGYLGFTLEIGKYVKSGDNTVHVGVRHKAKSRDFTGAGIYRNVRLTKQNKTHIVADGIRTNALTRADAAWKVRVGVDYVGEADFVRYTLSDYSGKQLAFAEADGDYIFEQTPETSAEDAAWTLHNDGNPRLYTLKVQLIKRDRIVDEASSTFAFRNLDFTEDGGVLLNGRAVRLFGVRLGDSYGPLGAAFNINAARRQLASLTEIGVNAVSAVRGCLAPEMYELCDETGVLVFDADKFKDFLPYDTLFNCVGTPKPAYYYYKSLQAEGDAEKSPFVKIFPHWDWNIGQVVDVSVYSNMKKTELFFGSAGESGKSLGRQITDWGGIDNDDVQCATWQVKYECGELVARAYDNDGGIAAVDRSASFWDATTLKASYDSEIPLRANGTDLMYIDITAYDEAGEFVANANNRVTVEVSGAARLVGYDNGDLYDYDSFKGDNRRLFGGRATAIIQTTLEAGEAIVEVSSRGLKEALLVLPVETAEVSETVGVSVPDLERYYELGYGDEQGRRSESDEVPARKVELIADKTSLSKNNPTARIKAEIFPADSDYTNVTWFCEFDDEYDVEYEDISHLLKLEGNGIWCQVTLFDLGREGSDEDNSAEKPLIPNATLPPKFRVCACCQGSTDLFRIISEIEMKVRG